MAALVMTLKLAAFLAIAPLGLIADRLPIGRAMRRAVHGVLVWLAGNSAVLRILKRTIAFSQSLLGVGTGAGTDTSGEREFVVDMLRRRGKRTMRPLCIFDVGANQGQFLALILRGLEGTQFELHAFEPSRESFGLLSNCAPGRTNVILNNCGLGKQAGVMDLTFNRPGSPLASLSKRRLDHFGMTFQYCEKVRIETLDEYCKHRNIEQVDLLKLDVEGHELDVLEGGLAMFRAGRINTVSFEFGGCNIDSRTFFQDFWYFFHVLPDWDIFRITPSGYLDPVRQYMEELEQFRTTNFVACRRRW